MQAQATRVGEGHGALLLLRRGRRTGASAAWWGGAGQGSRVSTTGPSFREGRQVAQPSSRSSTPPRLLTSGRAARGSRPECCRATPAAAHAPCAAPAAPANNRQGHAGITCCRSAACHVDSFSTEVYRSLRQALPLARDFSPHALPNQQPSSSHLQEAPLEVLGRRLRPLQARFGLVQLLRQPDQKEQVACTPASGLAEQWQPLCYTQGRPVQGKAAQIGVKHAHTAMLT